MIDKAETANGNLELWDRVEKTDPEYTKKVSMRGGYTAIDPQYQLKIATAEWGPYGMLWGLRDVKFTYVRDGEENIVEIAIDATFYYSDGGAFPISADMAYRAGDDCRKKVTTSARSKALSLLGFNADIFMGKFDDLAYVTERKKETADAAKAATDEAQFQTLRHNLWDLSGCDTKDEADQIVRFVTNRKFQGTDDVKEKAGAAQFTLDAMRAVMQSENIRHCQLKDAAEAWGLPDLGPTAQDTAVPAGVTE